MNLRDARVGRGCDGFTLTEVAVTGLIMMTVMGALFGVLESGSKVERRTQAMINSQEDVRFAMGEVLRDLRAADPLLPLADVSDYPSSVELQYGDAGAATVVRWALEATTGTLTRVRLTQPGGTATATTYRLPSVRNADGASPTTLFRYYNSEGTELTAASATGADFANCTIRVSITIKADTSPDRGIQPFILTSDAELRNRIPGAVAC